MNEREQFKLMHVKNDLRRIIVLSNMTKFRLANPCQNKESKQKKHDKRDKRNTNKCLSTRYSHNSAQIIFDITILNGQCLFMHGQYIL